MKGRIVDFLPVNRSKGRLTIDLEGDFRSSYDKFKDDDIELTIKRYSDARTLKANAYLWVLITAIGNALRISKEEVYFDMLKQYGQGAVVSVQKRFQTDFTRSWKYSELLGESELNGKEFVHYKFWVGSSEYSKEEFTILLDGVIQEAQMLGIETKPKEEIESMLKEFDRC